MVDTEYKKIWGEAKKFFSLQVSYAKLTLTEKLIVLVSMLFLSMLLIVLGAGLLLHFSFALTEFLAEYIGSVWGANLIVAFFYLLLIAVVYLFREVMIFIPISKFITKLILSPKD